MKQLLQNLRNGKTTVEEVPVPTVRARFALVKTAASMVSVGTERMVVEFAEKNLLSKARARPDLVKQVLNKARREGLLATARAAVSRLDQPMPLGYSSAGTITALGTDMAGFRVGQRVACAGSGYAVHAEYALVPRNLLVPLPEAVDFESAAFVALGAVAMHGLRLAEPQVGERIAVIGLGLLGSLAVQIAAAAGCSVFGIDIDPARAAQASRLGIQAVARPKALEAAKAFTRNRGFDAVLICADTPSSDPVELAGMIGRDRARIVAVGAVGLEIPRKLYYEKELSFINARSYGPGRYDETYEAGGSDYPVGYVRWTQGRNLESVIELMANGQLKVLPLISHRFPIAKAPAAYQLITRKQNESFLGILLTYDARKQDLGKRIVFPVGTAAAAGDVKLGVIGAGNFATATLLPAIKRAGGIELIGIASSGGIHAQHAAKKFGFAYAASAADEILGDRSINTVAILTRHDQHAELAVRVLGTGKHVFVEKPLALTEQDLAKVVTALKAGKGAKPAARGLLTVGFNRRFAPLAQKLKAFLEGRTESLYAHYRVNAGYLPVEHWTHDAEAGGGRIVGETCHFVDFITFLVGAPPVSVTASLLPDAGKYRNDNVSMTFSFSDGSLGVVDYLANGDPSVHKERLEVFCAGKVAVLDDFRVLETTEYGRRTVVGGQQDKGWVGEWRALGRAIRDGGEPPIPYDHLVGVTRATLAAVRSIQLGQKVGI